MVTLSAKGGPAAADSICIGTNELFARVSGPDRKDTCRSTRAPGSWCGDVHENVEAPVECLRSGSRVRDSAAVRDSSEYVDDFLEPLFREICAATTWTTTRPPPGSSSRWPT